MGDPQPAWSRESAVIRLADVTSLDDISPDWAFGGADGENIRVAVIDSGVDADHPMLGDCVEEDSAIEFSINQDGEVAVVEGRHRDVFGHGTAVTGIIHALAPRATITSVKVLGAGLSGKVAAFHAGLTWAVENEFDVINLSLGTRKRDWALAFHDVCDKAYFGGSLIVTAANNVRRVSYPSLFSSVVSVACNTATDPLRFHFNPDPPTEFLARGVSIEVPWLEHDTIVTTGNSFAAPHIAALATLIISKHPDLRPFQVKTVLWATAANVREAGPTDAAGRLSQVITTHGTLATSIRRTSAIRTTR